MDKRRLVLTACLVAALGISVAMAGPKVKGDAVADVSVDAEKAAAAALAERKTAESNSSLPVAESPVQQSVSVERLPATGASVEPVVSTDRPSGDPSASDDLEPVSVQRTGDSFGAASSAAADFVIPWQSINAGGGPSSSASYSVNASVGQSTIGQASSANYSVGVGYWYGASVSGGDCACDCQGDESCDGQPNVFDVVFCVGEAFRNDPYTPDPNPLCPLAGMNDVNLDGDVNVFDVVFIVNMAFRVGLREDNVCDPCTEVGPPSCPF